MVRAFGWGFTAGLAAGTAAALLYILGQALGGILLDGPYRNDLEAP